LEEGALCANGIVLRFQLPFFFFLLCFYNPTTPSISVCSYEECCFHFFVPLPSENSPKKLEKSNKILCVFRSVAAPMSKIFRQQTSKKNINIETDIGFLV